MKKHVLVLTTSAFILVCGAIAASAQQSPGSPMMQQPDQQRTQQQSTDQNGPGMMRQGGMMMGRSKIGQGGGGMMGCGEMVGHRGMMGPFVMRIIFALMDSDGDG